MGERAWSARREEQESVLVPGQVYKPSGSFSQKPECLFSILISVSITLFLAERANTQFHFNTNRTVRMKYTAAIPVLVVAAMAQDIGSIPECARHCISDAIKRSTPCGEKNYKCACQPDNFQKIQNAAVGCVVSACGSDRALSKWFRASSKLGVSCCTRTQIRSLTC